MICTINQILREDIHGKIDDEAASIRDEVLAAINESKLAHRTVDILNALGSELGDEQVVAVYDVEIKPFVTKALGLVRARINQKAKFLASEREFLNSDDRSIVQSSHHSQLVLSTILALLKTSVELMNKTWALRRKQAGLAFGGAMLLAAGTYLVKRLKQKKKNNDDKKS